MKHATLDEQYKFLMMGVNRSQHFIVGAILTRSIMLEKDCIDTLRSFRKTCGTRSSGFLQPLSQKAALARQRSQR